MRPAAIAYVTDGYSINGPITRYSAIPAQITGKTIQI